MWVKSKITDYSIIKDNYYFSFGTERYPNKSGFIIVIEHEKLEMISRYDPFYFETPIYSRLEKLGEI